MAQEWILYVDESGQLPLVGYTENERRGPTSVTGVLLPRAGAKLAQDIVRRRVARRIPFALWPLHGVEYKSPLWILLAFTNRGANPVAYGEVRGKFRGEQAEILSAAQQLRAYLQKHHSDVVEAFDQNYPHRAYKSDSGEAIDADRLEDIRGELALRVPEAWRSIQDFLEDVAVSARFDLARSLFSLSDAELICVSEDKVGSAWEVSGEKDSYAAMLEELFVRVRERLAAEGSDVEVELWIAGRFVYDEARGWATEMTDEWLKALFMQKAGFRSASGARSGVRCTHAEVVDYKEDASAAMVVADILANPLAHTLCSAHIGSHEFDELLRTDYGISGRKPVGDGGFLGLASVGESSRKLQELRQDGDLPPLRKKGRVWVRDQYEAHAKFLTDTKLL